MSKKKIQKAQKKAQKKVQIRVGAGKLSRSADRLVDVRSVPPNCPHCNGEREWGGGRWAGLREAVCHFCGRDELINVRNNKVVAKGQAIQQETCQSCGGLKAHHTDHAPNGFETCSVCGGTGKQPKPMSKGEMMRMISDCAIRYRRDGIMASLVRNSHMHAWDGTAPTDLKAFADAVLVDFINYLGTFQGVDYGMYTRDLCWENLAPDCKYRINGEECSHLKRVTSIHAEPMPPCKKEGCPEWHEPK